jgi:predicted O-methyltransferase YrrM
MQDLISISKSIPNILQNKYGYYSHQYPKPSGLWKNEQESLAWAALHADPNLSWMEIGSFCGASATILCEIRRLINAGPTVYSVDRNFDEFGPVFDECVYNIGKFQDIHKKIATESIYLDNVYNKDPLSFCFIDGWHSFKGAYEDFKIVNKYLVSGGIVCFHDTWQQPYDQRDLKQYLNMAENNYEIWMQEELPAPSNAKQTYNLDCLVAWILKNHEYNLVTNSILDGTNNCLVILQKR